MTILGNYVKDERNKKKWSLRECAKHCGLSHTHIDSIEKGVDYRTGKPVRVTTETLQKLAAGLGLDGLYLTALCMADEENGIPQSQMATFVKDLGNVSLTEQEKAILAGYHSAPPHIRQAVDSLLTNREQEE